uniref:Transmembrane protein n=1 Tax=Globodera pallida TaxID=36090 RepID=A0A183C8T0_GLOPA
MNPANDSNKNGKKDGAKKRKPQLQSSEDGKTEALTVYDLAFLTLLTSTVFLFNEGKKYLLLRRLRYKQRQQQLQREDVRVDCVDSKQKWSRRMNGGGAKMMI